MQTTAVTLKDKLRVKRPLLGGFVFSGDPNIPEIYAECGFDFDIFGRALAPAFTRSSGSAPRTLRMRLVCWMPGPKAS